MTGLDGGWATHTAITGVGVVVAAAAAPPPALAMAC